MATLVLAAAGAAIGGSLGGTVLGFSSAVVGKYIGGTIGAMIDQKVMGGGSEPVSVGRVDSLRLQSANEGAPVPRIIGRMRVAGHLIWAGPFVEHVREESHGGKGAPSVTTQNYSYTISLAIALGEGEISRIGRIWIDGEEVAQSTLALTLYKGSEDQTPDPVIGAHEGMENTPAFRGTAYLVIEALDLSPYGNRIPQFNIEVFRKAQPRACAVEDVADGISGVCLIPGTGAYSLATTPVHYAPESGTARTANLHSSRGQSDYLQALDDLEAELPNCREISLVVSWFGDDLRCAETRLTPRVEQKDTDGTPMAWAVSGVSRAQAERVSWIDERPVYGGTPADAAVVEAIEELHRREIAPVFYPFILMDIQEDNTLPDPWGAAKQPVMPWRGRITTQLARTQEGSTDGTMAAAAEVAAFFGAAQPEDFSVNGQSVQYHGPAEWSYRRFILHYAHLCAAAGGVARFCIGSEMRSLTQIQGADHSFPAVEALIALAQDVRSILGPDTILTYAADWSEYFGTHLPNGDLFFHLDALWACPEIDVIGIDNYMPLSDLRADATARERYDPEALIAHVMGEEGYDWYYASALDRAAQIRSPITDGAYDEPWVYRYKDLKNWWSHAHYNRVNGVRQSVSTGWAPRSKPIIFTEYGCPAVDKGTNQPNVFIDPKSSESAAPYFSDGRPDPLAQQAYLRAIHRFWADAQNNPKSEIYGGPMVDMQGAHLWAWDARPWPEFPQFESVWSDGPNYHTGHWISGRISAQPLARVVAEICEAAGFHNYDVSQLYGMVDGLVWQEFETSRQMLQPLMMFYDFTAVEAEGQLRFIHNSYDVTHEVSPECCVVSSTQDVGLTRIRQPKGEAPKRLLVRFWNGEEEYQQASMETGESFTALDRSQIARQDLPLVSQEGRVQQAAMRWLQQAQIGRDLITLTLPPSRQKIGLGELIHLEGDPPERLYRIAKIEEQGERRIEALRVPARGGLQAASLSAPPASAGQSAPKIAPPLPVTSALMDLPSLPDAAVGSAQIPLYLAATASPWPGAVALYHSIGAEGYTRLATTTRQATMGQTLSALPPAQGSRIARQSVTLRLTHGTLASVTELQLLNGANVAALCAEGSEDWEIIQFQDATLLPSGTWELRNLLRGQLGTEHLAAQTLAAGARFVLLNSALQPLSLPLSHLGLPAQYRIGPSAAPYTDPVYQEITRTARGVAKRPFAPVHLSLIRKADGAIQCSWIRRSRLEADSWQAMEIPLGEESEAYLIRLSQNGQELREQIVAQAPYTYSSAAQAADGVDAALPLTLEIAQIGAGYGPGVFARKEAHV